MRSVRADDTVLAGNIVPKLSLWRARSTNAIHIDGESIGVKRVEFVDESPNSECGWPIRGENSSRSQSGVSRFPNRICKPDDECGMETADRKFGALPHHGVTRPGSRD